MTSSGKREDGKQDPGELREQLRQQLQANEFEQVQRALRLVLFEMEAGLVQRRMLAPGIARRETLESRWQAGRA